MPVIRNHTKSMQSVWFTCKILNNFKIPYLVGQEKYNKNISKYLDCPSRLKYNELAFKLYFLNNRILIKKNCKD